MAQSPKSPDVVDEEVRAALAQGSVEAATEHAIRTYGPELIGWLSSILPNDADVHEAFSLMSEELWHSLPRFQGRCSVRTWCYMLARHAAARARARQPREQLLSEVPSLMHAVTHVWNTTRVESERQRDVFAKIRDQLSEDDQTLLVLRVDRDLSWRDIALVMLGESASDDELARKAAALRKQFERLKAELRELAAQHLRE